MKSRVIAGTCPTLNRIPYKLGSGGQAVDSLYPFCLKLLQGTLELSRLFLESLSRQKALVRQTKNFHRDVDAEKFVG